MTKQSFKASHDAEYLIGDINKLVERWNRKHSATVGTCLEGYVNGDIDLLFEYPVLPNSVCYPLIQAKGLSVPIGVNDVAAKVNDVAGVLAGHEVGNEIFSNFFELHSHRVPDWGEIGVFSGVIQGAHEVKHLVPSLFTVGLEGQDGVSELWADFVGESVMSGFLKPCSGFREWELNTPAVSGRSSKGRDYSRICVVDGIAQVLNGVATSKTKAIYSGFVSFGVCDAPAGLCVNLKEVSERSLFLDYFDNVFDVFRGPINLEARRLEGIV